MSRPRLLDLFCGAGGAAVGYHRAGFDVVGVDIKPQPNYPFEFWREDALECLEAGMWTGFQAIHASPPCQFATKAQRLRGNHHPNLIPEVQALLLDRPLPYVIENVEGARRVLTDPQMLCGVMFGLPLYRHRWFEANWHYTTPLHASHYLRQGKMGRRPATNEIIQPVGNFAAVRRAREAMDIDWMTRDELAQAIPPAYTEHIGHYLMKEIEARRRAAA